MRFLRNHLPLVIAVFLAVVITTYSSSFFLFWDTVQFAGKHGNHFYIHGFGSFLLPDSIDSGHPPLFGMYIAAMWSLFGKTLWVSHFAMLPFLIACMHYAFKMGEELVQSESVAFWFLFILFCNPFFLGQSILVSPDLVLLAAMLASVYAILTKRTLLLCVASCLLCLISQRGFLISVGLLVWQFCFLKYKVRSMYLAFVPGLSAFAVFMIYHFTSKGWISYHEGSPWAPSFQNVGIKELGKNVVVFVWRLLDFGNFILWPFIAFGIFKSKTILISKLSGLVIILITFFAIVTLPKVGLLNHRYFLPILILVSFIVIEVVHRYLHKHRNLFLSIVAIVLITGNGWVYHKLIAQGWDSTLAHVPFYSLYEDALSFIAENNIDVEEVGTGFPIKNKQSDLYLSDDHRAMKRYDLENDNYILWSNVINGISDEDLFDIENTWAIAYEKEKLNIKIVLFKRK